MRILCRILIYSKSSFPSGKNFQAKEKLTQFSFEPSRVSSQIVKYSIMDNVYNKVSLFQNNKIKPGPVNKVSNNLRFWKFKQLQTDEIRTKKNFIAFCINAFIG